MLRFLINNLGQKCPKISTRPTLQYRCYMSDKTENLLGGGLEKPQGGLREENYFYKQNNILMTKLGKEDRKLKCENYVNDFNQFEKVLNASDELTSLRETCSINKHKNCLEEAFFLNEQNECCTKLSKDDNFIEEKNNIDTTMAKE